MLDAVRPTATGHALITELLAPVVAAELAEDGR